MLKLLDFTRENEERPKIEDNESGGFFLFYSAETLKLITKSWLKLDLTSFLGRAILHPFTHRNPYLDEYTRCKHLSHVCYFKCKKLGNIFLDEDHVQDLYERAILHNEYKMINILKAALIEVESGRVKIQE
jgi:hypothetical protein